MEAILSDFLDGVASMSSITHTLAYGQLSIQYPILVDVMHNECKQRNAVLAPYISYKGINVEAKNKYIYKVTCFRVWG